MKRNVLFRNVLFGCILSLIALLVLTACECSHKDKNDDGICDNCDMAYTDGQDTPNHVHTAADSWIIDAEATCVKTGARHKVCKTCGENVESETLEKRTQHRYESGTCSDCGAKTALSSDAPYLRCNAQGIADVQGSYLLFGEYPQSLKAEDVAVCTVQDFRGYYLGSDGFYYAAVEAHPCESTYTFASGNVIAGGEIYYFRVEPIRWRILSEKEGVATILCDSIIDSKAYQSSYRYSINVSGVNTGLYYTDANGAPQGTYQNNYMYSEVRAWLNGQFYENAFTSLQMELIQQTTISNAESSTGYSGNPYVCDNTKDKIYLLSYMDVTKSAYGFLSVSYKNDTARQKSTTDYARAIGAYMQTEGELFGCSSWWLRSPYFEYSSHVREVTAAGNTGYTKYYDAKNANGIVPALRIPLQ